MGHVFKFGDLTFSKVHHALSRNGVPVFVGSRCLNLLSRLLQEPGKLVPVDELMRAGWGTLRVQPNNLSVQISALRKALGPSADGTPYIRAIAGRGYMLTTELQTVTEAQQTRRSWPNAAVDAFIGRDAEVAQLRGMLDTARLVTVAGMGGVGKTRLVQEVLATLTRRWVGVDLAPVTGADQVLSAIASALGDVHASADAIVAGLQAAPLLLVLDNAEHVIAELKPVLRRVLAECPGTVILLTSRRVTRLAGEAVLSLAPLGVPPRSATRLSEIAPFDGVKLFVERARGQQPGFTLSEDNCREVAAICRELDGIAFAVETVMPRLRAMSPAELLAGLGERFALVGDDAPDVLPRQRTLRTMLDWSWELLDDTERDILRRLSVFRAPATSAALTGLGTGPSKPAVLQALEGLIDKSLVSVQPGGRAMRFRLLQTTRDYIQATAPAPVLAALNARHARYMADLMEEAGDEWPTVPTADWLHQQLDHMDDLRKALGWASGPDGDGAIAVRLAAVSLPLWLEAPGTPLGEMNAWYDRVAPFVQPDTPARERAWFHIGQSWRATQFGDIQHRAVSGRAVAAARIAGCRVTLGVALMRYGHTFMQAATMAEALATFNEAEQHLRAVQPGKWLCLVLTRQADATVRLNQLENGLRHYNEAIDLAHALQFQLGQVTSISNMSEVLFDMGERDAATGHLGALVARIAPGARSPAMATYAAHLAMADRTDEALDAAFDVVAWAPVTGMQGPLAWAAETVALLLARAGRLHTAATISGYARCVLPGVDIRFGSRRAVFTELQSRLTSGLSPADLRAFEVVGAAWTLQQAVATIAMTDPERRNRQH